MRPNLVFATFAIFAATFANLSTVHAGSGRWFNVIDDGVKPAHGPVQLFAFRVGRASSNSDDYVCVAYIGNNAVFEDHKRAIALADQAFEEFIAPECASTGYRSKADGKIYVVARAKIYLGDVVIVTNDRSAFEQSLLQGTIADRDVTRVEYRLKSNIGHSDTPPFGAEYERVSQPEIPVGPSLREPNTSAVSTDIAPGVTISLENQVDHTYYGDSKPAMLIFFQTQVPLNDKAAQRALSQQVVQKLADERLKRHELKGVSTGAFNGPKRSRFHLRLSYRYAADGNGKFEFEN